MDAGAPGATTSRLRYAGGKSWEDRGVSPAREWVTMLVDPSQVDAISDAMAEHGALDDKTHGLFYVNPVYKAYTYTG